MIYTLAQPFTSYTYLFAHANLHNSIAYKSLLQIAILLLFKPFNISPGTFHKVSGIKSNISVSVLQVTTSAHLPSSEPHNKEVLCTIKHFVSVSKPSSVFIMHPAVFSFCNWHYCLILHLLLKIFKPEPVSQDFILFFLNIVSITAVEPA